MVKLIECKFVLERETVKVNYKNEHVRRKTYGQLEKMSDEWNY